MAAFLAPQVDSFLRRTQRDEAKLGGKVVRLGEVDGRDGEKRRCAGARRTEVEGTRQWRCLASTVASSAGDTTASRTHRSISCFAAHFSRGLSPCPISICTANLATTLTNGHGDDNSSLVSSSSSPRRCRQSRTAANGAPPLGLESGHEVSCGSGQRRRGRSARGRGGA